MTRKPIRFTVAQGKHTLLDTRRGSLIPGIFYGMGFQPGLDKSGSGFCLSGALSGTASIPILWSDFFLQGVFRIAPPTLTNLLVLQKPPFEPIRDISLPLLSCQVAFVMVITSNRRGSELVALAYKEPFLVLHRDKLVL